MLGPEHPYTLSTLSGLADVYGAEGKWAQAEVLYSQGLSIKRRVWGPDYPATVQAI